MDISNLSKVILMPHVSEKSVMIADNVKQQTFKVASTATKKDVKEAIEKLARQIPIKKIGDTDDVAYAVLYLASDESKFMTGAEIVLDGGLSAM